MRQVFESENISFVKVTEELLQDYLTLINDRDTAWWIGHLTEPVTEEAETQWIRDKLDSKARIWSMIEKKTGDFIGNIELMDIRDAAGEMGIAVTAEKQDMGCGTEAIKSLMEYATDCLGLRRIFLKAYPENARAIHVYEKCGFCEYDRNENNVFLEIFR